MNRQWEALEGKQRVWLLIRESNAVARGSTTERLRSQLRKQYRLSDRLTFHRVGIELYVGGGQSSPLVQQ